MANLKLKKMKKYFYLVLLLLFVGDLWSQQLAFPEAVGFGRFASGGRDGTVYKVTNLNDSGPGSLRDAVSSPNRIVVFEVAGVIQLQSRLVFSSNLTIAGQTAPGEGVVVYGNGVSFSGAHNVIVRHIAFRMGVGGDSGKDAVGIANGSNMIFDHVSASWGRDETFSISWDNKGTEPSDITIQNSIIAQGLLSHSCGGLMQTNGGVTLFRNLYIDNHTRNPKVKGLNQFVNNVVYNWGGGGCYILGDSEGTSWATIEHNYFINGPSSGSNPYSRANSNFQLFAQGNYHDGNRNGILDGELSVKADYGPAFWVENPSYWESIPDSDPNKIPKMHPELPDVRDAAGALAWILDSVGKVLPARDQVDAFLIGELSSLGTEGIIISSESELPTKGPGRLFRGPIASDRDNDGIPDEWELVLGSDPDVDDAMTVGTDGYTNIERYINSIKTSPSLLRYPVALTADEVTTTSLTFSWNDMEDKEHEVVIEVSADNFSFAEVGRLPSDESSFTYEGLESGTSYFFRMKSVNEQQESAYSDVLTMKTREEATPPKETTQPFPADQENQVAYRNLVLSWVNETSFMGGALYFDLYLGEDPDDLPLVGEAVAGKSFLVEELEVGTTYYWKLRASNVLGESWSDIWAFTTRERGTYNLLAHFPFDEEDGTSAFDLVSEAQAIAVDFVPEWGVGREGNALRFSGDPTASHLLFPHNDDLFLNSSSFSIALWFNSSGLKSDMYLLHKGMHDAENGGNGKWFGIQYKPDRLTFAVDDDVTKSNLDLSNPGRWFNSEWQHLVCIRDVEEQQLLMYVNGELLGSTRDNTTGGIGVLSNLVIGNCDGYYNTPFEGEMDDLRFYEGVLSPEAVYELYAGSGTYLNPMPFESVDAIQVFPNPFRNQLSVRLEGGLTGEVEVRLLNGAGQMVFMGTLPVNNGIVEIFGISALPKGFYLCEVQTPDGVWVSKVLK